MACDPSSGETHCMICLEDLSTGGAHGFLPCSHRQFHYSCICEWAQVTNRCPLCKSAFALVMKWTGGRLTSEYTLVEQRTQAAADDTPWAGTEVACEVCLDCRHEEILMLCDGCDRGFHTLCIGLVDVPDLVEWFCDKCVAGKSPAERKAQERAVRLVSSVPDIATEGKHRRRLRRRDDDEDIDSDVLVI